MLFQDDAAVEPVTKAIENNPVITGAAGAIKGITDGDVTSDDLMALWNTIGWPITKALILIILMFMVAGWARRIVRGACTKARIDITLAKFFGNMSRWIVLLLGGVALLKTFGIDTTSFAAVIAALGFAVGMALSGTLGNFASGVMLLVFRPFKVGDVVSAGGITGKVDEIGMFSTSFDTKDNRRIIVPNSEIYGATIENATFHDTRRVDVGVGTDYSADLDQTRQVLETAARQVPGRILEKDIAVYLIQLGGSSIDWEVRVWARTSDYWDVKQQLTRDIKIALDAAGIGIPFPQMDVHLDRTDLAQEHGT